MGLLAAFFTAVAVLAFLMLVWIDAARLFREKEETKKSNYSPKALVIVPCKGLDMGLYQNLLSLKRQRYRRHALIAVVDSESDPAVKEIKKAGIKYILSEKKSQRASGKVNAIAAALQRFKGYDAYVIADSDITAKSSWLGDMLQPLADKSIGISTTFPRFLPAAGFWSKVKMAWGFVGENLLENRASRFAWGGSMAFRKELVGRNGISFLTNSRYSVSDDICITMIARRKKLGIAYVKEAQPIVRSADSFSEFREWANRQTALTLHGYRGTFRRGMFFYCSEIYVFLSAIYLSLFASPLFLFLFIHLAISEKRSFARAHAAYPELAAIVVIMPFIYTYNLLHARFMKRIEWRGSTYRLY